MIYIFLGLLVAIFVLSSSLLQTLKKRSLVQTKNDELQTLMEKRDATANQLIRVQTPEFIEKEAREKLNMSKPGETIVVMDPIVPIYDETNNKIPEQVNWKRWWNVFF